MKAHTHSQTNIPHDCIYMYKPCQRARYSIDCRWVLNVNAQFAHIGNIVLAACLTNSMVNKLPSVYLLWVWCGLIEEVSDCI